MPFRRSCLQCETKGPNCFCSLDRVALERLESVGHWLRLEAHQEVLREGYAPDYVYVVCSGTLKLTTSSMDGRLLLLRIVGPGDVLGLSAALKRSRYEATAETLEICQLKAIPRTHFLLFMEEFQAAGRNSLMAVTRDYNSAVLSARRLALSTSAAAKLGSVLLEWGGLVLAGEHELLGGTVPNSVSFHMPLTHEELGHMAGISRETVTRTLTALRRDGLLQLEDDQMHLQDIARLQQQVG